MRFVIELDGPVFEIAAAHYAAYHDIAGEIGWSRLDPTTYWRLVRSKGREANILPGAKEIKIERYYEAFPARFESEKILSGIAARDDARQLLAGIARYGTIVGVTLGTNVKTRKIGLERANLSELVTEVVALHADPARRSKELLGLSGGDRRTVVVAATDDLVRAAATADLFCVAISGGTCSKPRLHRASPGVVFTDLGGLLDSLACGAEDLIAAGLLPPSHDV